ncbi:MAG: SMP-30/gluconolactonase/LRE family protein [Bacteroidetes bacterium]|nr:SMP-30/gluconolactonase/LRE family protein [Bacteroidota bacterium]
MKEYSANIVEHVLTCRNEIGEAPIWVPEEDRLYWTDTEDSAVFSYRFSDYEMKKYHLAMPITSLLRRRGGGWVIVTKKGLAFWDQVNNICTFIADPVADNDFLVFNDGAVDPSGCLIAGTMNFNELTAPDGCLFRLDNQLSLKKIDANICVANGISFSPDGETLYVSEQWDSRILAYDYNQQTGTASNRRTFAVADPADGYPDGIIVDSEGCLWNGRWGGAQIVRYTPDGKIDRKYNLPVNVGTCMAFGGENLSDLYITTAWFGMTGPERVKNPVSGDLFRIKTDVKGRLEPRFAG